jgi:N-acetylglucosaminyldiphosphoundecaprenol N-acetyl-beta-D-mannosaminyltransferase
MSFVDRDLVCLLGLPFDRVTTDEALSRVRDAVRARRRLFLSTPNLNFLVAAQRDEAFRASVVDSDLSVADGMPLVWMSRLLGAPLPERVTGSGLFERLRDEPPSAGEHPIRVYFFGGPPGAAEAAGRNLNVRSAGMVCVGHESPGFGSVEEMSGADVLERIDASGADFLVVALGAAKGQAWIQRNRGRLSVPVISHLGAVVNFAAGTVSRAPAWVQRAGLEWAWRIKEEPALWRRYARDARAFATLFAGSLLPHALWRGLHRSRSRSAGFDVESTDDPVVARLVIRGSIADPVPEAVRAALRGCLDAEGAVRVDLAEVENFGPTFAATLQLFVNTMAARKRSVTINGLSARTRRLLRWNGLAALGQHHAQPACGEASRIQPTLLRQEARVGHARLARLAE